MSKLFNNTWIIWILISIVTVVIYSGTLSYDILANYDDEAYLEDRIVNLNGRNIREYFSDYYLGMYQPLPVLSYAVVFHFFPGSIPVQREVNLLIHCINILLILILIHTLTGNRHIACLTAILFSVHPMNVEFVTWFSTRSNLMYAFFYLLAMILFLRWIRNQTWMNWTAMFISFTFALFCKVTAATFPLLAILLHWYSGKNFDRRSLLLYIPLIAVSAAFILTGISASSSFGHISELETIYTFSDRIFILLHAIWLYLYKAFIPVRQSVIYLYPWKEGGAIPVSYIYTGLGVIMILASSAIAAWKNRKNETGRAIFFGVLFFLLALSIVLPLKWSRTILIAERYTYLPYIGLFAGVFMVIFSLKPGKMIKSILLVTFTAVVILYSWAAFQRTRVWETPLTLFTDVIQKNRSGAEVSMGYYNRGNEHFRKKEIEAALSDYSDALKIFPGYADAWYNSGLVRYSVGDYDEAIRDFSKAIESRKGFVRAFVNRGNAYRATGRHNEALADYNRAITIDRFPLAYYNRGLLYYFNLKDPYRACSDWREALQLGYEDSRELLDKFCR